MKRKWIFVLMIILAALPLLRCGKTSRTVQQPAAEQPERPDYMEYFSRAKDAFDQGSADLAVEYLQNSIELNDSYVPARELLGQVYLAEGQAEKAKEQFETVLRQNAYSVNARLGLGRVLLMQNKNGAALEEFDAALRANPENAESHFYRGMALAEMGQEYRSKTAMIRAVLLDESFRTTVSAIHPLTEPETAKLFRREFLAIEAKSEITRADLAALLVTIIDDESVYGTSQGSEAYGPPAPGSKEQVEIADVERQHWAYNEIFTAVSTGLMDLFPEKTFRPESTVIKADFAALLQKVIVRKKKNPALATLYIGQESPFGDLNSAHWAYNACRIVAEYDLLEPEKDGEFGIGNKVAGEVAVIALEKAADIR